MNGSVRGVARRWLVIWLVAPVLGLCAAEVLVRQYVERVGQWYPDRLDRLPEPVQHIFIGSSRAGAAIRPEAFDAVLGAEGFPTGTLNLGQGLSTLFEHYLGLRYLHERAPESLAGATVWLEGPEGVPDYATVADRWSFASAPHLLAGLTTTADIRLAWAQPWPVRQKMEVTRIHLLAPSKLLTHRNGLYSLIWRRTGQVFERVVTTPRPAESVDLPAVAGIRTDPEGVALAREQVEQQPRSTAVERIPPLAETVVGRIISLVDEWGGQVVMFDVPMTSFDRTALLQGTSPEDRRLWMSQLAEEGVARITPVFSVVDSDFPDLLHLRASRREEYTRAVAEAWIARLRTPPSRAGDPPRP